VEEGKDNKGRNKFEVSESARVGEGMSLCHTRGLDSIHFVSIASRERVMGSQLLQLGQKQCS